MSRSLIFGIDAGGTHTRLLARSSDDEGDIRLDGPEANLLRAGVDRAAAVLASLVRKTMPLRPHHDLHATCIGMAGAGTVRARRALEKRLLHLLPVLASAPIEITHDGVIALEGAFGGGSGLLVIAGTGSIVYGRTQDGTSIRAGGWGYLLGDEGSGHAIGARGLRAVGHAFDSNAETLLTELLANRHGIDGRSELLHRIYQEQWPIQRMAPLVLEASERGDAVARGIVENEVSALSEQVARLVRHGPPVQARLALCGGLARSAHYAGMFATKLQKALPGWSVCRPEGDALEGAVRRAHRLSVTGSGGPE